MKLYKQRDNESFCVLQIKRKLSQFYLLVV